MNTAQDADVLSQADVVSQVLGPNAGRASHGLQQLHLYLQFVHGK